MPEKQKLCVEDNRESMVGQDLIRVLLQNRGNFIIVAVHLLPRNSQNHCRMASSINVLQIPGKKCFRESSPTQFLGYTRVHTHVLNI